MAGDWIKLEHVTPDKPEVVMLSSILGIDQDAVVGKLVRVWIWADQNSKDGGVNIPAEFVNRITHCQGFADAMRKVGWMSGRDSALTFPSFNRHNGQTAKSRCENNRRVADHRERKSSDSRLVIPRPIRAMVLERDNHTCLYCGRKKGEVGIGEVTSDAVLCIDHVTPVSRNGGNVIENMVTACSVCNLFKSNRTPDECGLPWPTTPEGVRYGVTLSLQKPLPEKRREEVQSTPTPREPESELPSRETAISMTAPVAVDPEFAGYVYDDWFNRGGKDGGGIEVPWLGYITKRWSRERKEWKAGTHKGKSHGSNKPNDRKGVDRNSGTANAATKGQYLGVGKIL